MNDFAEPSYTAVIVISITIDFGSLNMILSSFFSFLLHGLIKNIRKFPYIIYTFTKIKIVLNQRKSQRIPDDGATLEFEQSAAAENRTRGQRF